MYLSQQRHNITKTETHHNNRNNSTFLTGKEKMINILAKNRVIVEAKWILTVPSRENHLSIFKVPLPVSVHIGVRFSQEA